MNPAEWNTPQPPVEQVLAAPRVEPGTWHAPGLGFLLWRKIRVDMYGRGATYWDGPPYRRDAVRRIPVSAPASREYYRTLDELNAGRGWKQP